MRFIAMTWMQLQVCHEPYEQGSTRMICCTLVAKAELEKTGKGPMTHTSADIHYSPSRFD